MSKARFLVSFLGCFAALLVVWSRMPFGQWWKDALLGVSSFIGPAIHGWILETSSTGSLSWVFGAVRIPLAVQFDSLSVGLVPMMALLLATPGASWIRHLVRCASATVAMFAIHLAVVVMFPLLTFYKNAATDIVGLFIGMVAFVGAPVILWFVLTYEQQRQWLPGLRP